MLSKGAYHKRHNEMIKKLLTFTATLSSTVAQYSYSSHACIKNIKIQLAMA